MIGGMYLPNKKVYLHSETYHNSTKDRMLSKTTFLDLDFTMFPTIFQNGYFKWLKNIQQRWDITWNINQYDNTDRLLVILLKGMQQIFLFRYTMYNIYKVFSIATFCIFVCSCKSRATTFPVYISESESRLTKEGQKPINVYKQCLPRK